MPAGCSGRSRSSSGPTPGTSRTGSSPCWAPTRSSAVAATGSALLAANLRVVDEAGLPAYLEASNSANVPLYQRYGFVVHGSFRMPEGGPEVVTMWRDPQPL